MNDYTIEDIKSVKFFLFAGFCGDAPKAKNA